MLRIHAVFQMKKNLLLIGQYSLETYFFTDAAARELLNQLSHNFDKNIMEPEIRTWVSLYIATADPYLVL